MMHFRHRKQNTRHSNNNNHEGTVGPSHDNHYYYYDHDAKQEPCRRRRRLRQSQRQSQAQNRKHGCSIPLLLLLSTVVVVVVIFCLGHYYNYDFNYHDWLLVDVMKTFLKGPSKQDIQASHALRRGQQSQQSQQQSQPQRRRKPEDPRPGPTNVFTGLSRKQYAKWQRMQRYFDDEMSQEKKRIIPCTLTPSWMLDSIMAKHNNNNNNKDACAAFFSKEEKDKKGKSNNMVSKVASWFQKSTITTTPKPQKLLFRNTLPEKRYVCGHVLWGNGGILELEYPLKGDCQELLRPYVFAPHPPPVNGTGMRPIELYWNVGMDNNDYNDYDYNGHSDYYGYQTHVFVDGNGQTCPNHIACRRNDEALHQLQNVIRIKDTPWEIWSTMEGPEYYSTAKVGRQRYLKNVYFATTSFKSDIPMPYFSWSEYGNDMYATPSSVVSQNFHKVIQGASFLANNCDSKSHREDLVKRLMNDTRFPLRVDSLSSCLNNAAFPSKDVIQSSSLSSSSSSLPIDPDNKTQIQQQYLFHLAFENQLSEDYITEKLWGTFKSGTLPIYYGAPNVKDHLPSPNAAILVEDYLPNDLPKLLEYLHTLTQNPDLYDKHHQWRRPSQNDDDHQQQQFHAKYDMTHRHSTCRMCEWAYAKKHGLGWNHGSQTVQQPLVHHETCRNRQGFLGHPVKEYWYTEVDNNNNNNNNNTKRNNNNKQVAASVSSPMATSKTCTLNAENRLLELDHGRVQRYVYDQDGVTDMIIIITKTTSTTKTDDDDDDDDQQRQYVLTFKTPIASSELVEKESGKEYWLQDAQSRMTLLIDTNTTASTTASSTINIIPAVTMVQEQQQDNNSNPESTPSSFGMIRILPIVTGDNDDDGVAVLRLRIIVENLDTFHRGAIHRANYFGNLMTRDFFQPVEAYVIVPS